MVSMKKQEHEEALKRIRFELAAFGHGSIFNKKEPAVLKRIMDLEAELLKLEGQESQERRSA